PLGRTVTVDLPLSRAFQPDTPVVVATRETAAQPWTFLPATLLPGGLVAEFTTTHFSLFGALFTDLGSLASMFKTDFIDGLDGGATSSGTAAPTCGDEQAARADGYAITSSGGDTVKWCFGLENGRRVLKVADNRRY